MIKTQVSQRKRTNDTANEKKDDARKEKKQNNESDTVDTTVFLETQG